MPRFIVTWVFLTVISFGYTKKDKVNVGTVLFTESDTTKDCWSSDNIALLTSRMLLEDVLPSPLVLNIRDNAFVTDIIDYFRLVLEVVRQLTYGKTKHIMLLALTDTLGGYLHAYVLPIAKQAFYAGYIDFDSMEKLYQLFDELKCFLRTNGHGWSKAAHDCRRIQPEPLPIQPPPKCDPCKGLTFYKKSCSKGKMGIRIPLPFFDSKTRPTAIAVPFKTYSLRNIESKSASYVIVKYYMAATKCLAYRNASNSDLAEFNSNLLSWIQVHVKPHLLKDKFYAAFGGVLRVLATLKQKGAKPVNNKEIGSYNIMPESDVAAAGEKTKEGKQKKSNLILMVLLSTIFIWFLLGSLFICYRIRAAKNNKCDCDKVDQQLSPKSSAEDSKLSSKVCCSSKSKKASSTSNTTKSKSKKSSTMSAKSGTPSSCSICCSNESGMTNKKSSTTGTGTNQQKVVTKQVDESQQSVKSKTETSVYPVTCTYLKNLPDKYLTNSSSEDKIKKKTPFVLGYASGHSGSSASDQSTPREGEESQKPDFK